MDLGKSREEVLMAPLLDNAAGHDHSELLPALIFITGFRVYEASSRD